jgi:hypothetical protein
MSKQLFAAILGAIIALLATGGAEARVADRPVTSAYGSVMQTGVSQNFKARSAYRHASARSGKRYASSRSGKRHASSRSSRRHARAHSRGHGHSHGGTSRSCLTAEARGLLSRIESRFGSVSIVSTCRPGAVIATNGRPSKHRYGQAIDFDAGSRKGAIVAWLRANHHAGGTMTYRDMSHIHVDIGHRFVKLGAPSGRG